MRLLTGVYCRQALKALEAARKARGRAVHRGQELLRQGVVLVQEETFSETTTSVLSLRGPRDNLTRQPSMLETKPCLCF